MKTFQTSSLLAALCSCILGIVGNASAVPVALQQPTATFSQTFSGNFSVSKAIDGTTEDNLGWAIAQGAATDLPAQTAVFEMVTNVGFTGGSRLTFTFLQTHDFDFVYHTLGRFRISVTTDDRSLFADGLPTGGDVTANWTALNPDTIVSSNGATLTKLGDLSVLASGTSPYQDIYTISAATTLTDITGIRIEAMKDASLPFGGPGRQPLNGNFVLSELLVSITPEASNPPVVNCTPAPSGLVSWWPGEQTAADVVSSNSGTLGGNATFADGRVGSGFSFDGDRDGVNLGNPAGLQLQNFTIEAWIKRGSATICSLDQVQGPGGVMLSYGFGGYGFGVFDSGELFLTEIGLTYVGSPLFVTDTNYHHVAVSKSSGAVTFYLDGVAAPVANYNPTFQFVTEATIGAVSADRRNNFLGRVDELSVYNRALTAAEIAAIYNAGNAGKCTTNPPVVNCTTAPSGLVSWWPGETNALDRADGNNGTLVGDIAFGPGRVGNAFNLDGNTDAVLIGNPANLQLQTLTIECWMKRASTTQVSGHPLYGQLVGYGPGGYVLGFRADGSLFLSKNTVSDVPSVATITDTNWHHVAVTKGSNTVVFYIDGVPGTPITYNTTFEFFTDLQIGAVNSGVEQSFFGVIDEVSIYNRALAASEIQSIYNASTGGKCPPPPPPVITQHPINQTVNAPGAAQFTVAATGAPTLRYQWFFADNPLPNQTNSTLSIANALPANQGIYRVAVSNDIGFAISSNATLTVLTFAPVITRQPTNVTAIETTAASFSVQATGSVTLAYQWLLNGAPLPGKTTTTLSFTSVQLSNAGNYSVIVTNPYGSVTSSVATLTVNPRPPCAPVHDGLVSWWRGESNALDGWDSNNGTTLFGLSTTPGKVGSAFGSQLRTGVSVYVNDSPSLRPTNAITLELWINPTSLTGTIPRILLSKFDYPAAQPSGTQSSYLLGMTNNGQLFFTVSPNGSVRTNTTLIASNALPINQWTHIAATYDGGALRLYINGVLAGQTNYSGGIFPGTANFGIGAIPFGTSTFGWPFSGALDEVSLYNRALSAAEIQSIFTADLTGKCLAPPVSTQQPQDQIVPLGEDVKFTVGVSGSRPLAYQWYFNGATPQNRIIGATNASLIIERIRTNNAGLYFVTVTNSVGSNYSALAQLSTSPAPFCTEILPGLISWWTGDTNTLDVMGLNNISLYSPPSYPTGKVASAFTFNGISSRITVNNSASLNFGSNANFSIEMWIKANSTNTTYANMPLFDKRTATSGYSLSLFRGQLAFSLATPSFAQPAGVSSFVSTGPDLRDAMFHHVAVTVNRSATNGGVLYVDGLPVLTFNPTARINSLENGVPLIIGGAATQETNSPYTGLIDEPAIYNRALTAAEILSIRTAGAAGRCKAKPVIVTQPANKSVELGSNYTMTVTASGTPLLRYQWRRNTALLSGATNSSLTLSNASLASAGTYSVIVSNAFGSVLSSNAIVVITNRAPTALSGSFAVTEDHPIDVLLTGTDPELNPLTYSIVAQPTNGILSGPANSRFRIYTPNPNYNGPDFFTYKVNDGFSDSPIATMSITVRPANDAPTAASQEVVTDEDAPLNITLQGGDVDGDIISYEIVQQPVHGVLSGSLPNLTYTPAQDYFGSDYFTFITRDSSNAVSQLAAVVIAIRPVNDAPVARIVITPLDQLPGETNTVLISPACCDTTLVLDGSQSSDVENVPLTYIWMDGTNVIATTATFTNRFAPGVHELALIVSDGELTGMELLTFEILKTEEAVLHLQMLVQNSSLARNEKAALINWLSVTIKALEHCNVDQAVKFLERFEGRVAERIAVINAKDAERWITISQAIREVAGLCETTDRPCHDKDEDEDEDDDKDKPKHDKSDDEKSDRDRSGSGSSKVEKATAKAGQENRGDRGISDEVRAGKSSLR